ncbi:protein of unknown function [Bartonella clarridgeiae 73]|uniref:Uncharacterized protein n=1 Tax=Bartonella clarridgeiae (strain CCUG 45776 / CIP 104772 / 73) TaxID=696125 RepID=E6YG01_BARC7|nr:MAG: hypothetical protein PG977_000994 [Bartonella clarridgeiae]CBI75789.1 protein of unknown function [Bartonella clarridgeiae 73]
MAPQSIIFAMDNPDPKITSEEIAEIGDDAIIVNRSIRLSQSN